MKLSTLYTSVPEYIEFAWVTTPAASGQTVANNSIVTLNLNTEVQDTGDLVSPPGTAPAAANQFILPAGTYYFEALCPLTRQGGERHTAVLGLYNVSDNDWVSRGKNNGSNEGNPYQSVYLWSGQFKISSQKTFDLRIYARNNLNTDFTVWNAGVNVTGSETFTSGVSTSAIDQRTTLRLWKLK